MCVCAYLMMGSNRNLMGVPFSGWICWNSMRFKWRSKVKVTMIDPIRLPFRVNVLHSQREIEIEIGRSSGMKWNGMRDHGIGRKTSDKFEWFSGHSAYTLITIAKPEWPENVHRTHFFRAFSEIFPVHFFSSFFMFQAVKCEISIYISISWNSKLVVKSFLFRLFCLGHGNHQSNW